MRGAFGGFPGSPGAQDQQVKSFTSGKREVLSRVELTQVTDMPGGWGGGVGGGGGLGAAVQAGFFGGGVPMNAPIPGQPGMGQVLALSESKDRSKLEMLAMTSRIEGGQHPRVLDAKGRLDLGDRFATLPDDWTEADVDSGRVLLSRGVPLGELATQHIGPKRKFACLTQYGVHHLLKGARL